MPNRLSILIWGIIYREPEHDAAFCQLLRSQTQDSLPNSLYLSGWGRLTFENITQGNITVWPYRPVLQGGDHQFLTDGQGNPITISYSWLESEKAFGTEYLVSMVLEQPFGFMTLKLKALSPVTLSVNPDDFVLEDQVIACPEKYGYDYARTRQLQHLPAK
jgi:hypothetical protein